LARLLRLDLTEFRVALLCSEDDEELVEDPASICARSVLNESW
jgi:hypothetical protein